MIINTNNILASNIYDFEELKYQQSLRNVCQLIWNDQLFEFNKTDIYNIILEQSIESVIYIDELITRMLQDNAFKWSLLIDVNIHDVKQILIDYMECMVLDDYFKYFNFQDEPKKIYNQNKLQYKNNLMVSLYNLGYSWTLGMTFIEYAEKCLKLHSDLKRHIEREKKVKSVIKTITFL